MINHVDKEWGSEDWLVNNDSYCSKFLNLKKGYQCSVHYHAIKDETFYVLEGMVELQVVNIRDFVTVVTPILNAEEVEFIHETAMKNKVGILNGLQKVILKKGDQYRINPFLAHKFTAITDTAKLLEVSTQHMDEDSYRVTSSGPVTPAPQDDSDEALELQAEAEAEQRSIFWAQAMRDSVDFDARTIYDMLAKKLERLYICFRDYSHCVWDSNIENTQMRALRITLNLAKRIAADSYETKKNEVEAVHGKLQMSFTPINDGRGCSRCDFYLDKTPPEGQEKAMDLYHKASIEDAKQKTNEEEYFWRLIKKYINSWWD